jgi:pimeloyl-ACP methyl ester carboxylesterase
MVPFLSILPNPKIQTMIELVRQRLPLPEGEISFLEGQTDNSPVLHFAHATGFNAETYTGLLAPLAAKLRVLASDARGHGFTTLPSPAGAAAGWRIYRDDLHRFLKASGEGPYILAGHSMGATASLMVAVAAPELVSGLLLIEPVLVPRAIYWTRWLRAVSPGPDLAARAVKRRKTFPAAEAVFSSYRGRGAFRTWPDETVQDYLKGGLKPTGNGTEVTLACAPEWEAETFRSTPLGAARLAKQVRCPVTLLYAEQSTPPERECKDFARRHGRTRLIKVPGTTHFLPMERPELVREEILRLASAVA